MAASHTASGKPTQTDGAKPANIPAATTFSTSGAPVQTVPDVDPSHPAVDADPRAGTTGDQNRIDFNDPTIPGHEAVAAALNEQGIATKGVEDAEADARKSAKGK